MKGLEITRAFYEACRPQLYAEMPQVMSQACAGLCGEGSECFGCDDELSKDHDFNLAFCLWLPEDVLAANKDLIKNVFHKLPRVFQGISTDYANDVLARRGPLTIEGFYNFFTGLNHAPESWQEWLAIPETQLAAATNGEIFEDNAGIFSTWRRSLLTYPEDVRLKKLAACSMQMAQSGQYNLPRCLKRGEYAAAFLALAKFSKSALAFAYLANKHYMPFYKWAPRIVKKLPTLGHELAILLNQISTIPLKNHRNNELLDAVEGFCALCAHWLNSNDLSDTHDSWLWAHGPEIMKRIKNSEIQRTNLLKDSL